MYMGKDTIELCEVYRTLKNSGPHSGSTVLVVRLFGTDFKSTNDRRRYAWGTEPDALKLNRRILTIEDAAKEIRSIKGNHNHWVVCGGEPLLQQEAIINLITKYMSHSEKALKPYIEIETHGLIKPIEELDKLVGHYNVYVPLSNSMNDNAKSTFAHRIKESVLEEYVDKNSALIFDVDCDADIQEVVEIQRLFKVTRDDIWLRPLVIDSRGVMGSISILWKACLKYGYRLSNRFYSHLHGNMKRGI